MHATIKSLNSKNLGPFSIIGISIVFSRASLMLYLVGHSEANISVVLSVYFVP